jgi:restriction endonuclease S subunit
MTKEQECIVTILDKFAALVNGTTPPPSAAPLQKRGINPHCRAPIRGRGIAVNIPAEIALRKKHYEHYREKLLTFNELNSPPLEGCQSKTDGVV